MAQPSARVLATRYAFGIGDDYGTVLSGDPLPGMVSLLTASEPTPPSMTADRYHEFKAREQQTRARKLAELAGDPLPVVTITGPGERLEEDLRERTMAAIARPQEWGLREGLVRTLSNLLCVSSNRGEVAGLAAPYEAEAIRPNATGSYSSIVLASASHPAMLSYLDAGRSIGPLSRRGGGQRGLNENYAREVLELHTLGVDGGYSQEDVRELALGLTGWALNGNTGNFSFEADRHEPGPRRLLGHNFPEGGVEQGQAMLTFAARHPATARRVCTRLAMSYLGPQPPGGVVDVMTRRWMTTGGSVAAAMEAMLRDPAAWNPAPLQPRTPEEWLIASARLLGIAGDNTRVRDAMPRFLRRLGQYPFSAPSPQGYPVDTSRWISPEGVMVRIAVAAELAGMALSARPNGYDPRALAARAGLTGRSAGVVEGAPNLRDGIALVLLSPEFASR